MIHYKYHYIFIRIVILFLLFSFCPVNVYASNNTNKNDTMQEEVNRLHGVIQKLNNQIDYYQNENEFLKNDIKHKKDTIPFIHQLVCYIIIVVTIAGLLLYTIRSRERIFKYEGKNSEQLTKLVMENTFGMPGGTVRGILAISILITFIISILIYFPDQIPDSIKVTAALVFGFYFAKNNEQRKEYMDRMMQSNNNTQKVKRKEALQSIESAQKAGAKKSDSLFNSAKKLVSDAENENSDEEAEKLYDKAILKAQMAQQSVEFSENTKKAIECNKLTDIISNRLKVLKELNIQEKEIQELYQKLIGLNTEKKYDDAFVISDKLMTMIDYIDEGPVVKKLKSAKENLDASQSLGLNGTTIIKGIFSIIQKFNKDKNDYFIDLLRKRITGSFLEEFDIKNIVNYLKQMGHESKITSAINQAVLKFDQLIPINLREKLKDSDLVETILNAGEIERENLLISPEFEDQIGPEDFYDFIKKIRNNIVDEAFSHIKLPDDLSFSQYKNMIKSCQNDDDGRGALKSVLDVLETGKDILTQKTHQKWTMLTENT